MIPQLSAVSLLVVLVQLVDRLPTPPPTRRGRGRPTFYDDRLFLKALVIMIVKHLHTPHELLSVLAQDSPEMAALRPLLCQAGRYPTRRTGERRLAALPDKLPAQIRALGTHLVARVQPWANSGRAVAADSMVLRAKGGVWHRKHRQAGEVPHTSIDTAAHWTKSGWHGWVYGWKLHLLTVVAGVWIPLAAELTAANADDGSTMAQLLWWHRAELPTAIRYVLGDQHYNTPLLRAVSRTHGWTLVATHRGRRPKVDDGKEVRRVFHKLRSLAIENFNEHFKGIFGGHAQVPTRGLVATRRWALGAVFVYQLALLYRHEQGLARAESLSQGRWLIYDHASTNYQDGFVAEIDTTATATGDGLLYATYLGGGNDDDTVFSLTLGANRNVYLTGATLSSDFLVVNPYTNTATYPYVSLAFVTRLNLSSSISFTQQLSYSTILNQGISSKNGSVGYDIAVDTTGYVYVGGWTDESNFPIVHPLPDGDHLHGFYDGFIRERRFRATL